MGKINLKDKKILVTGGNGYLGRNLINRLLIYQAKIFSLDLVHDHQNKENNYYNINLLDNETLVKIMDIIKPDIIYHLAASLDRTRDFSETNNILNINLTGTVNLLNALKNIQYENLIFTSTSDVYGGASAKAPFRENDIFIPASPYSLSKFCAETAIQTFSELNKKRYTILRLFNFVGKDMPDNFFIPQLIKKIRQNMDFDMTYGEQIRDILYIDDILEALILSLQERAYNNVFNVCSSQGQTIKHIALEIKKVLKSKSNLNFGNLPYRENEIWEMVGDNTKIEQSLGFNPRFKFTDIIKKLVS